MTKNQFLEKFRKTKMDVDVLFQARQYSAGKMIFKLTLYPMFKEIVSVSSIDENMEKEVDEIRKSFSAIWQIHSDEMFVPWFNKLMRKMLVFFAKENLNFSEVKEKQYQQGIVFREV